MEDKPIPLDYIMNLPKHLINNKLDKAAQVNAWRMENILKNVVVRRITEIRTILDKPTMKQKIAEYLNQNALKDERGRIRIKEQVIRIYEQKNFEKMEENDPNFNKIISHIERLLKMTTAQTLAIDSLERKIMHLSKRNI